MSAALPLHHAPRRSAGFLRRVARVAPIVARSAHGHREAALSGVEVESRQDGPRVHRVIRARLARMPWLHVVAFGRRAVDVVLRERPRPAKRRGRPRMTAPSPSAVTPGTRLVVAIAPAFTIGLVGPRGPARRREGVEREAGALTPVRAAPPLCRSSRTPARRRTACDAHDRELDLRVSHAVDAAACAHDADPEELGRYLSERRVDLRRPPFAYRRKARMRFVNKRADSLGWRKLTSRDKGSRACEVHPGAVDGC